MWIELTNAYRDTDNKCWINMDLYNRFIRDERGTRIWDDMGEGLLVSETPEQIMQLMRDARQGER